MGQASRICFVGIPFLMELVALACLILVMTGDINSGSVPQQFYFLKANTTDASLGNGITLQKWYTVGLWNYCSGNSDSTTPDFCSTPTPFYYFNPVSVWHLDSAQITSLLPSEWNSAITEYSHVAKWQYVAYWAATVSTGVTLLCGLLAFCSRLGSFITCLMGVIATIFTIAASATATALNLVLMGLIKEKLGAYGVSSGLGRNSMIATWIASALGLAAGLFWLFTTCCCAPDHKDSGRRWGRKRPVPAYQQISSPYVGGVA